MRFILGLFIFLGLNVGIFAQYNTIKFDNYTVENGLSHNYIHAVTQDQKGWIWMGTSLGIERFDGYRFKAYPLHLNDTTRISSIIVRQFFETRKGELLACFEEYGIGAYNREKDMFEPWKINGQTILSGFSVKDLVEDTAGNIWAATKSGVQKIDLTNGQIQAYTNRPGKENSLCHDYVREVMFDSAQNLWIGTKKGLDLFNPRTEKFTHFSDNHAVLQDDILEIFVDKDKNIWVGTDIHGIVIINPKDLTIDRFYDEKNERSFKVQSILQDKNDNFWIGTRGGLYFYSEDKKEQQLYENNVLVNSSLVNNSVLNILEDRKGDLWIGTRGGMSHMIEEKQAFNNYRAIPGDNKHLNDGEIYCFWIDEQNNIWIGTENGGVNILDRKKQTFSYITQSDKNGLSKNCIKAIMPDGHGNVLIAVFQGGLNVYNRSTGEITWHLPDADDPHSISGDVVWDIASDQQGDIWIATENGLDLYDPVNGTFEHIPELEKYSISWIGVDAKNDLWLGADQVLIYRPGHGIINAFDEKGRDFFEDSKGRYWLTTEDKGIVQYDKYNGAISYYDSYDGLASNMSYCMLEDHNNNLWISTATGLSRFDPEKKAFKNFHEADGLQGDHFLYGAAYKSRSGELLFGGNKGFTIFEPENIRENTYLPPVYITDLRIFNQPVVIQDDENAILEKSIMESEFLEIPYKYNVVTFEFTALNYDNSTNNKYQYILEGFEDEWNETVEKRTATYTNLNPGEYTFKVKGANNNGLWNPESRNLTVHILPPYYKTWWFRIMMFILVSAIFIVLLVFFVKRKNLKNALVFEKEKANKLHELDMFKLRFFTNISHEIKTPLTLIVSPLEKLLNFELSKEEVRETHLIMKRNTQQLLKLVTQLLDYRKLDAGKMQLELKRGDIVSYCRDIINSFESMMIDKKITHHFKSVHDEIITQFDPDKLEKIMNNVVSNAIKHTDPGGSVSIMLSVVIEEDGAFDQASSKFVKIVVKDSGTGISEKKISQIFNRYYSTMGANEEVQGTGIGLAFTKELVELHKGKIFAESVPNEGSTFTLLFPYVINPPAELKNESGQEPVAEKSLTDLPQDYSELEVHDKRIMMIIEDNPDVRKFIASHFCTSFMIVEASNGKEGLDKAINTIPDIIISDIMMPVMSGNEMCEKLKNDERTSHIPVLLLSALSSQQNIMEGLIKGADDYITKPFDIILLQTKVENLLSTRKSLREKYSRELVLKPTNVTISSPDERFLEKAIQIVEDYMDDPNLNIDKFSGLIGISKMQLYRKMAALTNMTVKEFVNDIRLKRAAQLIGEKKVTISETAYMVGFNDISYFGKCFRKKFGMSASAYASQQQEKD